MYMYYYLASLKIVLLTFQDYFIRLTECCLQPVKIQYDWNIVAWNQLHKREFPNHTYIDDTIEKSNRYRSQMTSWMLGMYFISLITSNIQSDYSVEAHPQVNGWMNELIKDYTCCKEGMTLGTLCFKITKNNIIVTLMFEAIF